MKKYIAMFLVLVMCLSFVACNSKTESENANTSSDSNTTETEKSSDSIKETTASDDLTQEYAYSVEINGQTYYANTREEIDEIIRQNTMQEIEDLLGFISDGNAYEAESPMIEIASGGFDEISGDYFKFYFKVRNISDIPIKTVTINVDVLDEFGDIVDTTHPQEPATIEPGQALVFDCITKNERGAVEATVSSYSLYTVDTDDYYSGRIDEAPIVKFFE